MSYDENEEMVEESVGRRGRFFITTKSSIKEDLQTILEHEKEIGTVVYGLVQLTKTSKVPQIHEKITALVTGLDVLRDKVEAIQDALDATADHHTEFNQHMEKVDHDWEGIKTATKKISEEWDMLHKAAEVIFEINGRDASGNPLPESTRRLERWMKAMDMVLLQIFLTAVLSGVFWLFQKTQVLSNDELIKQIQQLQINDKTQAEQIKRYEAELAERNRRK